jgi:hypothetical protein
MYFGKKSRMPLLCANILSVMKKDEIPFLVMHGCFATLVGCAPIGIED